MKKIVFILILVSLARTQDYPFPQSSQNKFIKINKTFALGGEVGLLGNNSLKGLSGAVNLGSHFFIRGKYGQIIRHDTDRKYSYYSGGLQLGENIINGIFQYYAAIDYGLMKFPTGLSKKDDSYWMTRFGANFFVGQRFALFIEAGFFSGVAPIGTKWMEDAVILSMGTHVFVW